MSHKTDCYETVKISRKEIPAQLKTRKLQKGQVSAYRRGKVLAMKWEDKRDVCLLSTIHSAKTCTVERRRKSVTIPELEKDYNLTMGGIDRVDQGLCNYSLLRKRGERYFKKLFSHLLELTIWNAFILYNKTGHKKKSLDFRLDLIEECIAKCKKTSIKFIGRTSSENTPPRLSAGHFPDIVPATEKKKNTARLCVVCSCRKNESGKKIRKESRYFFKECDVGLCVVPWSHYIALTNKFAKTLLPPDSLDVDAAYQDFCNTIKKAAKKTIPRGYRKNYIPCWDAEYESLYKTFLQSPQDDNSSLTATALLSKLDRKRRD